MKAKKVHLDCIKACKTCPQFRGFDGTEINEFGRKIIDEESSMVDIIDYWTDKESIGGNILWEFGYNSCLSRDVKEFLEEAKDIGKMFMKIKKLEKKLKEMHKRV